jgi:deoxyribonuclease-4
MELEFVQGVKMGEKAALQVREVARRHKVTLTAHSPYFINLNAREPAKIKASQERILQTARIAALCGAESIVFHAGFYMGDPPVDVYEVIKRNLLPVLEQLDREGNMVWVRPEVTGKHSQFGDLEEVLRLSSELPRVAPCIDFAHWHARTVSYNSYGGFSSVLKRVADTLGTEALAEMHIHVSGISYSKAGELKHLLLKESDFHYEELLHALRDHTARGTVICESPSLEDDALILQESYAFLESGSPAPLHEN